jgi:hypothetical protein
MIKVAGERDSCEDHQQGEQDGEGCDVDNEEQSAPGTPADDEKDDPQHGCWTSQ